VTPARRLVVASLAGLAVISTVLACNSLLGVEDVSTKEPQADGSTPDPDADEPISTPDGNPDNRPNVLQTALGEAHACARKPDGTVQCWGDDLQGQTGSGEPSDAGVVAAPRPVRDIADAIDIAAGRNHTCVARESGGVSCWGFNLDGQLGNGESANRHPTPVSVTSLSNAVAVAAGGNFSCAIRASGTVVCWGGNGSGQLGRGDQTPATTPVSVVDLQKAVAIAAGQAHACAVRNDGAVLCWGDGANGQLGSGGTEGKPSPTQVEQLPEAVMISAGERSTCALTTTGRVYCWGANELGQLGSGAPNINPNPRPSAVANLDDAVSIATGRNHTCAVRKGGAVVCWGAAARGQLGDGLVYDGGGAASAALVTVTGLGDAIGLGAGGQHSCAPTKGDAILCWGANDRGQLGRGDTVSTNTPVNVTGFP